MTDINPAEINEPNLNEVSKTAVNVQEIADEPKVDNNIQRERKIDKELARGSNPGSGKVMFNDRP
jgi:hypothetical protein